MAETKKFVPQEEVGAIGGPPQGLEADSADELNELKPEAGGDKSLNQEADDREKLDLLRVRHRSIDKRGVFHIGGIRYIAPSRRDYAGEEIVVLDKNTAGLVRRDPETRKPSLTHIVELLDRNDPRLTGTDYQGGTSGLFLWADTELTKIIPFDPVEFDKQRPNESDEEFRARLNAVTADELEKILNYPEARRKILEENVELLRKDVLALLQKHNIIETLPDQTIVVDTDALSQSFGRLMYDRGVSGRFSALTDGSSYQTTCWAFKGLRVISRRDYAQAQEKGEPIKTKPLFYMPKNPEAAFDAQSIKRADFYLGPDAVKKRLPAKQITESGESVDFLESELAFFVYHPRYGNGYRDAEGKLIV